MRLLILGGTVFLGRHLTLAAEAHRHEVTLFTRGKSFPARFPEAEHLHGDRTNLDTGLVAGWSGWGSRHFKGKRASDVVEERGQVGRRSGGGPPCPVPLDLRPGTEPRPGGA